jgi:hypothetical protein
MMLEVGRVAVIVDIVKEEEIVICGVGILFV